ncbi:MAG: hypothetical protein IT200_04295 [Thermoleophilia bacterium]|nr:hypothetical protein [Thermoleophilia bacterium]
MKQSVRAGIAAAAAVLVATPIAAALPPEWSRTATQAMPAAGEFSVEAIAAANGFGATAGLGADTANGRVPAVIERSGSGSQWSQPIRLGEASRLDFGPLVARNGRGDAVAVWGSVGGKLTAAVRFAGSWGKPVDTGVKVPGLRNGNADDAIKVAMGADRRARIGVLACSGGACTLSVAASAPKAARWAVAGSVRTPRGGGASAGWALGAGGNAVIAWRTGRRVTAAQLGPRDRRFTPARAVPSGDATGRIAVDAGATGESAIGWTTAGGGVGVSVRLRTDPGWRTPRRVGRPAGAGEPRVGVSCEGSIAAGWVEPGTPKVLVKGATAQGTDGLFTETTEIGTYGDETKALRMAGASVLGKTGIAYVGWTRAEEQGAGGASRLTGDRAKNGWRGQNQDGFFREGPGPAFAPDGTGVLVGTEDAGLRSQEFTPGDAIVRCP